MSEQVIAALRLMIEDTTLPAELRQEAAAKLAALVPDPADGVAEMLRVAGDEAIAAVAELWRPEHDE